MKNYPRSYKTLLLSCLSLSCLSSPLCAEDLSAEQALVLRRITEYWRDGDLKAAKAQILDFLQGASSASVSDQLYAMLGDLYFQEDKYSDASGAYEKIESNAFLEKVALNYFQSLHELKEETSLVSKGTTFLREHPGFGVRGDKIRFLVADSLEKMAEKTENPIERELILRDALEHYSALEMSRYKEFALFAEAAIQAKLGNQKEAARLYLGLSEAHPEQAEELLFSAAHLQSSFDPEMAAETFLKLAALKGEKSQRAAHNALVLLYQNSLHLPLLEKEHFFRTSLVKEDFPLLDLYLGLSHFQLEQYGNAKKRFLSFLEVKTQPGDKRLSAMLHTAECARRLEDPLLLTKVIDLLSAEFPEEPELAKALVARAHLEAKKGHFDTAIVDLKETLTRFSGLENREDLVYNYAILLTKQGNWEEAREFFYLFLEQFPASGKIAPAWRALLTSSLNLWKDSKEERKVAALALLIDDLQKVLSLPQILEVSEIAEFQFFLATKLFEENRFEEASAQFERYATLYPESEKNGQIHYLLTLCLFKLQGDTDLLISYAEKALSSPIPLDQKATLNLHLFNAYLGKQESDKAAEHLYLALVDGCQTIKMQNIAWLADHYFEKCKPLFSLSEPTPAQKKLFTTCKEVFSLLFPEQANGQLSGIDAESVALEKQALKYGQLLEATGKQKEQLSLLSQLVQVQNSSVEKGWKHRQEALFSLAEAYRNQGDVKHAVATYDQLIDLAKWIPSYYASAAMLETTRLKYEQLSATEKTENHPAMAAVLNNLKDLQISKKLAYEPIYLEAALQYVDIRTEFAPSEEKNAHCLFFLKRLREDFSSEADPLTREYLSSRNDYPEKSALYDSYMQYVESKILFLEALIARQEGYRDTAKSLKNQAIDNLKALKSQTMTSYLEQNVDSMKKEIEKSL